MCTQTWGQTFKFLFLRTQRNYLSGRTKERRFLRARCADDPTPRDESVDDGRKLLKGREGGWLVGVGQSAESARGGGCNSRVCAGLQVNVCPSGVGTCTCVVHRNCGSRLYSITACELLKFASFSR